MRRLVAMIPTMLLLPRPLSAEWVLAVFAGASRTNATSLSIRQRGGFESWIDELVAPATKHVKPCAGDRHVALSVRAWRRATR
jgi:hypothetical protein